MEIRNFAPQMQIGEKFFILECGYGVKGAPLYKLCAEVEYGGVVELTIDSFEEYYKEHAVTTSAMTTMLSKWKRKKIFGIFLKNVQATCSNMFIKAKDQVWTKFSENDIIKPCCSPFSTCVKEQEAEPTPSVGPPEADTSVSECASMTPSSETGKAAATAKRSPTMLVMPDPKRVKTLVDQERNVL